MMGVAASARKPKIGLVLGGGGAKGAAEVGVLKALEKAGIHPDYIVGTSIGSVVGGLYASGVSVEEMERLFLQQNWIDLFVDRKAELSSTLYTERDGMHYILGYPIYDARQRSMGDGLLKGDSITSLLGRLTGHTKYMHFDQLKIPFRCVSFDVQTMEEVVLDRGVLPECLRASISIPLAFTSVNKDGKKLIDGGAVNNLPVDVVKRMGAEIVIAVDLDQSAYGQKPQKAAVKKENSFWDDLLDIGVQAVKKLDFGKYVNWFMQRPDEAKYHENLKKADYCINPDLHEYNLASFTRPSIQAMIKRGEQAGAKMAPTIMTRLLKELVNGQ